MASMSEPLGLRERKKLRTRRALVEAALRLFGEQGYQETTIAEITAAADVSARTFFSYFGSKEDVLFFDHQERTDEALKLLADRRPDEPIRDVLLRLVEHGLRASLLPADMASELSSVRYRLVSSIPALRARGLQLLFETERRLAAALHETYPGELDRTEAAAVIGALSGAANLAVQVSMDRGEPPERAWEAGRRAAEIAMGGLAVLGRGTV
jgi:AcrR family transcriptional regulator